jgi:ABC-type nickel/cobalt efflux system permease component RcnA
MAPTPGSGLDSTVVMLLSTAGATALFHTLIPDHWLPFVLVGRARHWSARTTALVAGFSALIHVALSIVLGLITLGIGLAAAEVIGHTLEKAGGVLLVLFGLVYAAWSWRKGGHFHPGGSLFHVHDHDASCDGDEGDRNPEHLHYHADDKLIRGEVGWSAMGLALIVGVNPCVLILPIMLASASKGATAFWLVVVAYVVPTVVLMVGLSAFGVAGSRRLIVPGAARYMELVSGLLIAALGIAFLLLHE